MKNWIIPLVIIVILSYVGYLIGSNLILPRCNNLPSAVTFEDCQQMVNEKLLGYQLQGVIYGAIAGLIISLGINLIIKKFKKNYKN